MVGFETEYSSMNVGYDRFDYKAVYRSSYLAVSRGRQASCKPKGL